MSNKHNWLRYHTAIPATRDNNSNVHSLMKMEKNLSVTGGSNHENVISSRFVVTRWLDTYISWCDYHEISNIYYIVAQRYSEYSSTRGQILAYLRVLCFMTSPITPKFT